MSDRERADRIAADPPQDKRELRDAILAAITEARNEEREASEAVLSMAVGRLGGEVEGAPTARINFLQRIDELRAIEVAARPPAVEARSDDAALVIGYIEMHEGAAAAPGADWKAEALAWRRAEDAPCDDDGSCQCASCSMPMARWAAENPTGSNVCVRVLARRIRVLNERAAAAPETP